jgi:hypothetical protein
MSTPITGNSNADRILQILTAANAGAPIVIGGVSLLLDIFNQEQKTGKTDAEIAAQWNDSMETALRTRTKKNEQLGNQP